MMKKHKYIIIILLFALAIPLVFWWGVGLGRGIDDVLTNHGEELIRLQCDIQGLQIHVAELIVDNDRLKYQLNKMQIYQDTIKIHIPQ